MSDNGHINSQIVDAIAASNQATVGYAPAQAMAMLDAVMAETIGMHMHGAVMRQQNAQAIASAAVATSCARILQAQQSPPKAAPPVEPPPRDVDGVSSTVASANSAVGELKSKLAGLERESETISTALDSISEKADVDSKALDAGPEKPDADAGSSSDDRSPSDS